jgi:hypothetical protein
VKNATKHWVCDKVKDWLIEDATTEAKEQQRRIKDDYKVTAPYKRVYMGQQLALKQLYADWDTALIIFIDLRLKLRSPLLTVLWS